MTQTGLSVEPVVSPVQLAYAITHDAPAADRLQAGLAHIEELRKNPASFAIEPRAEAHLKISEAALKKESDILAAFPDVRLLDPAALKLLLNQDLSHNRPPRLAPFQLNDQDADCKIEVVYQGQFGIEEKPKKKVVSSNPSVGVQTNFHSLEMERVFEDFTHKLVEQAFHAAAKESKEALLVKDGPQSVAGKGEVTAIATLGQIIIPEDAKAIITKARESKLFDTIYLLAEASSWEIKSKASTEVHLPRNVDPLIVAEANGKLWVLGAFDLTAAERQVWNDFCVRPWGESRSKAGQ